MSRLKTAAEPNTATGRQPSASSLVMRNSSPMLTNAMIRKKARKVLAGLIPALAPPPLTYHVAIAAGAGMRLEQRVPRGRILVACQRGHRAALVVVARTPVRAPLWSWRVERYQPEKASPFFGGGVTAFRQVEPAVFHGKKPPPPQVMPGSADAVPRANASRICFSISMIANSATPTPMINTPSASGTGRVSNTS